MYSTHGFRILYDHSLKPPTNSERQCQSQRRLSEEYLLGRSIKLNQYFLYMCIGFLYFYAALLKGLCQEINISEKAYPIKLVLSVHVFSVFNYLFSH
jgi:hypothetical protein